MLRIFREIGYYRYIIKTIKEQENTHEWKTFNLRHDWIYRIYTVVSIDSEIASQLSSLEVTGAVLEKMQPINNYLSSNKIDFKEIITPSTERIQGTNSWLVVYSPLFKSLTLFNFLRFIIIFIVTILTIRHFDKIEEISHLILNFFKKLYYHWI